MQELNAARRAKAGAGSASWRPQIAASARNIHNLSDTYGLTHFLWLFPFVIRGRDRLPAQAGLATFTGCFRGRTREPAMQSARFSISRRHGLSGFTIGGTRMSFNTSHEPVTNWA